MNTSTFSPIIEDYATREDWLDARPTFIGASESAAILGEGYAKTNALTVFADKVTPRVGDDEDESLTIGRMLERGLLDVFRWKAQLPCQPEMPFRVRRHPEHPFIACTLDAWTPDEENGGILPVELKYVSSILLKQWDDENQAPLKFQIQASHQLLVTGAPRCYLFGLIGHKAVVRTIERNERFIEFLKGKLIEFWGFVQRRELPTHIIEWASDATSDALKRLHPADSGETVVLPAESVEWWESLAKAKADKKAADEQETEFSNRIRAAMAENTYGLLNDGRKLSLKTAANPGRTCPCCNEPIQKGYTYRTLRMTK